MGMIDRFGRIADTYVQEKSSLLESEQERRRVHMGHAFWPTEVLRDSIIFASMLMVLCFYCWLIPPPLHSAADPFAQAGFVFPDWYVLFSYGYLRWGEYLPQFVIPAGPIGEFLGSPVISWNAAWWGAALTGIPVGILALPPFLPGREKRGVEDPWFATAGAVYLAHVWFISVYSINIFLELYAKDRTDYCWANSKHIFDCGRQAPWTAEVFNAVPWILTGIFIFAVLFFAIRWSLVNSIGARLTPSMGKQVAVGSLILAVLISAVTWPIYEGGFWDYGGLGAMDDIEELETMRGQPSDTLVYYGKGDDWQDWEDECLTFSESSDLGVWDTLDEDYDPEKWCVIPAVHWSNWGIYQPTQRLIIDFEGFNDHSFDGKNSGGESDEYIGTNDGTSISKSWSDVIEIEDLGVSSVFVDVGCNFRTTERGAGTHTQDLTLSNDAGNILWTAEGSCDSTTLKLTPGVYRLDYQVTSSGVNESVTMITDYSAVAFQPLLLDENGAAANRAALPAGTELSTMTLENPTFEKNPKSLDAKLTYSIFVPCLGVGAIVFFLMRSMARGYEWEMNKCYGCDLCDDACPVRLFNAGDKLNIIYNTWNNEDDGVPLYSCLTCTACTNACPQLVDYDSYVDIRRNLIVGGPPAAEIPHTVLQAVLAAEAEEDADIEFIPVDEYPIDCLLYTSPSPRDVEESRMPSSA